MNARIKKIAREVREGIRRYLHTRERGDLMSSGIDTDGLGGACAIASYTLARVLKKLDYNAKFVHGYFYDGWDCSHCWVVIDNREILDITATQFGEYSQVHVARVDDRRYHPTAQGNWGINRIKNWAGQSALAHMQGLRQIEQDVLSKFQK